MITLLVLTLLTTPHYVRASWYGYPFHGRQTACGDVFNRLGHTAAHRTLPCGTRVRIHHPRTQRSVIVRITDRGPFIRGRSYDLSEGAARTIGLTGVEWVEATVLSPT